MKNKTSRVNKMKLKKAIVASLAIFILLAFTGCGTSSSLATTEHTKQENPSKTEINNHVETVSKKAINDYIGIKEEEIKGATLTPSISPSGDLSFTND